MISSVFCIAKMSILVESQISLVGRQYLNSLIPNNNIITQLSNGWTWQMWSTRKNSPSLTPDKVSAGSVFKRWKPRKRLNIFKSGSPSPCWCLRGAKSICCAEHFIPTVAQLQSVQVSLPPSPAPPHRTFHFSVQWTTHRELRSTIGLHCTVTDIYVFSVPIETTACTWLLSPVGWILSSTDFCRPWRK